MEWSRSNRRPDAEDSVTQYIDVTSRCHPLLLDELVSLGSSYSLVERTFAVYTVHADIDRQTYRSPARTKTNSDDTTSPGSSDDVLDGVETKVRADEDEGVTGDGMMAGSSVEEDESVIPLPPGKEKSKNVQRHDTTEKGISRRSIVDSAYIKVLSKDDLTELEWPTEMVQYTKCEPKVFFSCNPLYFDFKILSESNSAHVSQSISVQGETPYEHCAEVVGDIPLPPCMQFVPRQLQGKKKLCSGEGTSKIEANKETGKNTCDAPKKTRKKTQKHRHKVSKRLGDVKSRRRHKKKKKHKEDSNVEKKEQHGERSMPPLSDTSERREEKRIVDALNSEKRKSRFKKKSKKKMSKMLKKLQPDRDSGAETGEGGFEGTESAAIKNSQKGKRRGVYKNPSGSDDDEVKRESASDCRCISKQVQQVMETTGTSKLVHSVIAVQSETSEGRCDLMESPKTNKRTESKRRRAPPGSIEPLCWKKPKRDSTAVPLVKNLVPESDTCHLDTVGSCHPIGTAKDPISNTPIETKNTISGEVTMGSKIPFSKKLDPRSVGVHGTEMKDTSSSKWDTSSDDEPSQKTTTKKSFAKHSLPTKSVAEHVNEGPSSQQPTEEMRKCSRNRSHSRSDRRRRRDDSSYSSYSSDDDRSRSRYSKRSYSSGSESSRYRHSKRHTRSYSSYSRSRSRSRYRSRSHSLRSRSYSSYSNSDHERHRSRRRYTSSSRSRSYSSDYYRHKYSRSRSYSSYSDRSRSFSRSRSRSRYRLKSSPDEQYSSLHPKKSTKEPRMKSERDCRTYSVKDLVIPYTLHRDDAMNDRAQELLKKVKEKKQSLKEGDVVVNDSVPARLKSAGLIGACFMGTRPEMMTEVAVMPVIGKLPNKKRRPEEEKPADNEVSMRAPSHASPANIPLPPGQINSPIPSPNRRPSQPSSPRSGGDVANDSPHHLSDGSGGPPPKKIQRPNSVKSEFENKVPLCRGPRSEMDSLPLPHKGNHMDGPRHRMMGPRGPPMMPGRPGLPPRIMGHGCPRPPFPGPPRSVPPGMRPMGPCPMRGPLAPPNRPMGPHPHGPPPLRSPVMNSRMPGSRIPPPNHHRMSARSSISQGQRPSTRTFAGKIATTTTTSESQSENRTTATTSSVSYIGPQVPPAMAQSLGLEVNDPADAPLQFKPKVTSMATSSPSNPPLPPLPNGKKCESRSPPLPPKSPPESPKPPKSDSPGGKIVPMAPPEMSAEQAEQFKLLQQQAQQHAAMQQQREAGVESSTPLAPESGSSPSAMTMPPHILSQLQASVPGVQPQLIPGYPISQGFQSPLSHLPQTTALQQTGQGMSVLVSHPMVVSSMAQAGIPVQAGTPLMAAPIQASAAAVAAAAAAQAGSGVPGMHVSPLHVAGMQQAFAIQHTPFGPMITNPAASLQQMQQMQQMQTYPPLGNVHAVSGIPGISSFPAIHGLPGLHASAAAAAGQQQMLAQLHAMQQSQSPASAGPFIIGSPFLRIARPPF